MPELEAPAEEGVVVLWVVWALAENATATASAAIDHSLMGWNGSFMLKSWVVG